MKRLVNRKKIHVILFPLFLVAVTFVVWVARPYLNAEYQPGTPYDRWQAFDRAATILGYVLAITAIYAGLDGWWNKDSLLRRFLPKQKYSIKRDAEAQAIEKNTDVLIMLHHTDGSALSIVNVVNPKVVLLITTNAEGANKFSESIEGKRKNIQSDVKFNAVTFMTPVVVSNKGSSTETCERTISAIDAVLERGYERKRIVVDITGTTKPMSIGAFEAADSKGINTIYLESQYASNNARIEGSEKALYIRRYNND